MKIGRKRNIDVAVAIALTIKEGEIVREIEKGNDQVAGIPKKEMRLKDKPG